MSGVARVALAPENLVSIPVRFIREPWKAFIHLSSMHSHAYTFTVPIAVLRADSCVERIEAE